VIGVELTDESTRLADLVAAQRRTVIVLGNESTGIPAEALEVLRCAR
jgi:tRNA (guanosine-2'-O-)-methyltransferase